jgi:hypothetical protein
VNASMSTMMDDDNGINWGDLVAEANRWEIMDDTREVVEGERAAMAAQGAARDGGRPAADQLRHGRTWL